MTTTDRDLTDAQQAAFVLDSGMARCICPGCAHEDDVAEATRWAVGGVRVGRLTNLADFLAELGEMTRVLTLRRLEERRPDLEPTKKGTPSA
jgi:hypothetical protein